MRRFLLVLLAQIFGQAAVDAADIDRIRIRELGLDMISVKGPIVRGDAAVFSHVTSDSNQAIVLLNSEGGIVVDALAIGRESRRRNFATSVAPNKLCASACALIWLAGARRYAEDGSAIGFHASYIEKDGALLESGVANALVGAYVSQLGLSDQVVAYVTSAPPKGMLWLTRNDAARLGLPFISASTALGKDFDSRTMKTGITADPHDPVATVARFYKHLSAGDGNSAAALVIPEKRGTGPFNELDIARFFGQMQEPLVVEQLQQVSENVVSVRYRYRKDSSKSCVGNAKLTTTYKYGRTLIERIAANC
jgi:hypothetical protein